MAKNTICLWYDKDAEAAARFYAEIFPNSAVGGVHRAPSDYPSGKEGDVLTVEFTVAGVPCIGLNGGPAFKHNEATSIEKKVEARECHRQDGYTPDITQPSQKAFTRPTASGVQRANEGSQAKWRLAQACQAKGALIHNKKQI
jgi:predicted 3-demethylubiquinone-9 3-methyltransferase (glyoxalase superfamily)